MTKSFCRENLMMILKKTWATHTVILVLIVAATAKASALSQGGDGTIHNLRLISSQAQLQGMTSPVNPLAAAAPSSKAGDALRSRKVRDVSHVDQGLEDDMSSPASAPGSLGQEYPGNRQSTKAKALYPPLSGSGELFRLFRPLALTPDKTIGMTRWYLPGFGYFNRGGRAASSNFIRFGRSGVKYFDDDDGLGGGGDVNMVNRNNAKKKNNFIRLGRENPRTTNFIRLGRSGPPSPGEFYNSGYITSSLSDSFRDEDDERHPWN